MAANGGRQALGRLFEQARKQAEAQIRAGGSGGGGGGGRPGPSGGLLGGSGLVLLVGGGFAISQSLFNGEWLSAASCEESRKISPGGGIWVADGANMPPLSLPHSRRRSQSSQVLEAHRCQVGDLPGRNTFHGKLLTPPLPLHLRATL